MVSAQARRRAPSMPKIPVVKQTVLMFEEGLDELTPPWKANPGALRSSSNYEVSIETGYETTKGYERFDGQAAPSDASYIILDVTITGEFSDGDTVTGVDTAATGVIVVGGVVTSGAQDYLVMTKITGTFSSATEDLQVSAVTEGNADAAGVTSGASTNKLHAQYKNLAADEYRNDIAAVPGSGSVLGVIQLGGTKYAFRNNSGDTATDLYKSSSSGWTQVALGRELSFTSGGTTEIAEGQVLDGLVGASPGQATLTRVILESGTWAGGDAAGRFIFASQTGTFEAGGVEVSGSGDLATIAGDSSAITLAKDGRFEFDTFNFGGNTGEDRIYGADGVNRGFEFDGTAFAPIDTGMTTDAPLHVRGHRNHLFFSFLGSAQHSGIGTPYIWSPVFGASELAIGSTITGFVSEPGSASSPATSNTPAGNSTLGIYNETRIHMLHGTSSADWNLVRYREEIGGTAYTMQQMANTMFLGSRGITDLQTVQAYGNFQHATYSRKIQKTINLKRNIAKASCIVRDKNQYRVFFTDKTAIYTTLQREDTGGVMGMMPIILDHSVECIYSQERNGTEEIFFGSTDGMVYQMEKGTSFDGGDILATFTTHYDYQKMLRWIKRYLDLTLEVSGTGYAEFSWNYQINYGDAKTPQPTAITEVADLSGTVNWDAGEVWDGAGFWDGTSLTPKMFDLGESGENFSLIISSEADYFMPLTFSGALLQYTLHRMLRNNA